MLHAGLCVNFAVPNYRWRSPIVPLSPARVHRASGTVQGTRTRMLTLQQPSGVAPRVLRTRRVPVRLAPHGRQRPAWRRARPRKRTPQRGRGPRRPSAASRRRPSGATVSRGVKRPRGLLPAAIPGQLSLLRTPPSAASTPYHPPFPGPPPPRLHRAPGLRGPPGGCRAARPRRQPGSGLRPDQRQCVQHQGGQPGAQQGPLLPGQREQDKLLLRGALHLLPPSACCPSPCRLHLAALTLPPPTLPPARCQVGAGGCERAKWAPGGGVEAWGEGRPSGRGSDAVLPRLVPLLPPSGEGL